MKNDSSKWADLPVEEKIILEKKVNRISNIFLDEMFVSGPYGEYNDSLRKNLSASEIEVLKVELREILLEE